MGKKKAVIVETVLTAAFLAHTRGIHTIKHLPFLFFIALHPDLRFLCSLKLL